MSRFAVAGICGTLDGDNLTPCQRCRAVVELPEYAEILGVRVHNVDYADTLQLMVQFIESGCPHQVATVNPEFIMRARRDAEFRRILSETDLCLPDGIGILWAGRLLGYPFKARVTGVDTTWRLLGMAAERGFRVFLLGAAPGVAERTAQIVCDAYPKLIVAGTHAGSSSRDEDHATGDLIFAARPDILLVAYGAPAQDKWIYRNQPRLNVPLAIGVGGTFDFISGVSQRAPNWLQRVGLEWFHRLYCEPWRWRRMTVLPLFALRVMWQRVTGR
jgi:N-acetylglucosaminyldiphosphoundecaprenol N-acetyl-beta-D-mannosaminyltransferase